MSTIIMNVPILNKQTSYLHNSHMKPLKQLGSVSRNSTAICLKPRTSADRSPIKRRSGNYKPPTWDFDYIQSLNSEYAGEDCLRRISELKMSVKIMLKGAVERVDKLELVNDLQKLGISYHFEGKIKQILENIYHDHVDGIAKGMDLYSTALEFMTPAATWILCLSRYIKLKIFDRFKNEEGEFKESLVEDTKGLLELYEASFLMTEGEKTLELAKEFATKCLQKQLDEDNATDDYHVLLVRDALDLPLHWRVERPKARWFIEVYQKRPDMNPVVLELAKLDFNVVQAIHQEELKHISRWWKRICLAEKLSFARDRITESYVWNVVGLFEPQYAHYRITGTKVNALITILDDIFDVYEIFDRFKNEEGEFKESLVEDTKGLLELYEASFLMTEGEKTLELAKEFATKCLQKQLDEDNATDDYHVLLVRDALDLPLHWRVERPKARWFIEVYQKRPDMNPVVLELAKLDFNVVQAIHQEELKHISRWDIKDIEQLPHYMQLMFLALNNLVDDVAYDVLKDHGVVIIPYLRKLWADLSQTYFQEAKWYYDGYKPSLQEYMENGWISQSAPVILGHAFFLVADSVEMEVVQSLFKYHNIIRFAGVISRLANDLGTSVDEIKRGDVLKSVQCYMNQTGCSEEEAREHVKFLISEAWKDMNEERVADSPFPYDFIRSAVNLGRTVQYLYHHGDGHGLHNSPTGIDDIRSLLFEPIA
ncbi:Terpinolene synthase [Handroanthus impetiginosus]|uniref:Terpinolene synthase n=1 Tax=Handroanthus impetiginosus TaxID=429701 RepID=A0A2G9HSG4_9LAMI|nr:Terpinolene synthase [Handroanthus impetiginosus]